MTGKILAICCFLFSMTPSYAQDPIPKEAPIAKERFHRFGLGIVLCDPTGVTMSLRFTKEDSMQMHVGWGFRRFWPSSAGLTIAADYTHHFMSGINPIKNAGTFAPAIGVGGKLSLLEGSTFASTVGVRLPAQMSFFIQPVPIEIFIELALGIYLWPAVSPLVDGGLGARWYF